MKFHSFYSILSSISLFVLMPEALASWEDDGRYTVTTESSPYGSSLELPHHMMTSFCGDSDGCEVILGMYNWDGSRRTASKTTHLFFSPSRSYSYWGIERDNRWMTSAEQEFHMEGNGENEVVLSAWSCAFIDGSYLNFQDQGDPSDRYHTPYFSLMAWNQHFQSEHCTLTIID